MLFKIYLNIQKDLSFSNFRWFFLCIHAS